MPRIPFIKKTKKDDPQTPIVRLADRRFHFNRAFALLAELEKFKAVRYHVDPEKREIEFEFLPDLVPSEYKLEKRAPANAPQFRCSAWELVNVFPWIAAVHKCDDEEAKKLIAKREGIGRWIVNFTPMFETVVSREKTSSISSNACGIYRYRAEDGAIVYIGKGQIRRRLSDPDRAQSHWNFSVVEFSEIEDEQEQFRWECFWLTDFAAKNGGRYPYYNRQGGNQT